MDQPVHDPGMEGRVERLERDMADVKATLGRIEPMIISMHAQMPHLATKAELERVRGEIEAKIEGLRGETRAGLAAKPGYGAMWSMGIALFALVVAAISAGAAYLPLLSRSLRAS